MLAQNTRVSLEHWAYTLGLAAGLFFMPLVRGQDSPARLTFDVASIKLTTVKPFENKYLIQPLPGGEGYSVRNAPVQSLIGAMYNLPWQQITGGPEWLEADGYDIEAKADHSYRPAELRVMFQNLLADRFKLKFHREIREGPVYVLTVDKARSKLKVSESPRDPDPNWSPHRGTKGYVTVWEKVSMAEFCRWLRSALQSQTLPIIDKTGLDKNYDFSLAYLPEFPPDFDKERLPAAYRDLPSLIDALPQQLGLVLQRQKGPVEYYVIDHVERPTEN
jgi:uncharacterized protein (TIGR03435 family)